MFEWLFKFERIRFEGSGVSVQSGSVVAVAALVVGLLVAFGLIYAATRLYASNRARAISLGLRVAALVLLCLPLLEPVLVTPDVVPNRSHVAVLVDASASMSLADGREGRARGADALRVLGADAAGADGLLQALDERFQMHRYAFAEQPRRADSLQQLAFDGGASDLAAALERVQADFEGRPLAGIVLLTDGGYRGRDPDALARALGDGGAPLHVVGLGQEAFEREREVVSVDVSDDAEVATRVQIDVRVRGWEAGPAQIRLYDEEGTAVLTETRRLSGEGRVDRFSFYLAPEDDEPRAYRATIAEAEGELNGQNNALRVLVQPRTDTARVLYFEGQLRPDFKFIKRALEDDPRLGVASVLYTSSGKLYRQGIERPDELAGGFPATEAVLNGFDVVVLGDLAAATFAPEQIEQIERFVRRRGGGFLMLGGRQSFTEGGYADTPIADLLPAQLDESRRAVLTPNFQGADSSGFRFVPTAEGLRHPVLRLAARPDSNRRRWAGLPRLQSINYLGAVKPGAAVLARKPEDAFGASEPLLVVQRYGKGRSAALPTAGTWRWQLQQPTEDERHARFWRQLIRWLAASAPGRVEAEVVRAEAAPGEAVRVTAQVYDSTYAPLSGATVRGRLVGPAGSERATVAFEESLLESGSYEGTFTPQAEGTYRLEVTARAGEQVVGRDVQHVLVRPSRAEFLSATLKRAALERLATASGGAYYTPDAAGALPERLRSQERANTAVYRTADLWDMPLLFGLVILLLSVDWVYRRRQGLP